MQKSPSCIKIPLNKAKKILGPPYSIGELFQCPPSPTTIKYDLTQLLNLAYC